MNNQRKIENEYMTVEFDTHDPRVVIVTSKVSGEVSHLSLVREYFSLTDSNKQKVYLEWGA